LGGKATISRAEVELLGIPVYQEWKFEAILEEWDSALFG